VRIFPKRFDIRRERFTEAKMTDARASKAETFQHYLNTPGGALYGFAPATRGTMPLAATTVGGLYLASAFTGGGGYTGAILGGGWAACAAMKAEAERTTALQMAGGL
jgi:all-trans-retinol 13,14-reductase